MSAPVRFLFVAVAGWALFRGATAGMLPGAEAFAVARAEAAPPPIIPTQFAPIAPVEPPMAALPPDHPAYAAAYAGYPPYGAYPPPRPVQVPVYYYPSSVPARHVTVPLPPTQPAQQQPAPEFYAPIQPLEDWDLAQIARGSIPGPPRQSSPAPSGLPSFIPQKHLDRMQLDA